MSNKEIVIEAIRQLPDQAGFEVIAEAVGIPAAIRNGEADVDAVHTVPRHGMERRFPAG
jgi:hypothetical protein